MSNTLMIVFHYHPSLEIGAVRSIKFSKYLPEFGWKPFILTVNSRYYGRINETPLEFECKIYRTMKWPVLRDIYLGVRSFFGSGASRKLVLDQKESASSGNASDQSTVSVPFWKRVIFSLSWTPDDKIGWLIPAVRMAIKIIRRENIDVIYTSGPPWTCHVIGLVVKKFTGRKWVADFRDPWDPPRKPRHVSTVYSRRLEQFLADRVASNADLILTATREHRNHFLKMYGGSMEERCFAVLNGYDEDDFKSRKKRQREPDDPVTFLYAGNMYLGRDPFCFLIAAGELLAEGYYSKDEINIQFRGSMLIKDSRINGIVSDYRLEDIVTFRNAVKRADYLDLILNADVLLLMQGENASVQIPGKTFEYIATGNEIIALVSNGATRNFLGDFDRVSLAGINAKDKIKECIRDVFSRVRSCRYDNHVTNRKLQDFTRKKSAETLSGLLDCIS